MSQLPTILVAYASKHGSTREVADAVAIRLRTRGLDATLMDAADAGDVSAYDGVVLGAALYMGRPHRAARAFLKRHHAELAKAPFAVFAMGPLKDEEGDIAGSRAQLDKALARYPELAPAAVAIVGGVIDPAELRFPFNRMPAGDARDWDAVERFADEVYEAVAGRLSRRGEPVGRSHQR